ncbi:hypothetical protein [uncultured Xylophilus sp.]|uniref:hypothetical protein n=1 Tax=uncultured Xylophilus sp. TaxID=296832 RepID=UPI0025EB48AA|nr:hypothetical protein [uncultured Xylophilus sp.]
MQITPTFQGLEKVQTALRRLSGAEARGAFAKALNDTGFHVRRAMQTELGSVFDRATPYIQKSSYVDMATPDKLVVEILPTYQRLKGIDPQQILAAQEAGGRRRDKRSEVALQRAGLLPRGYQTAIPATPYPGSDDGRGNLRGSFLVQLLAYFEAFGEQGYKSNMNDKGRARVQRGTKRQAGRRYFVSFGRLRGGTRSDHLAPGIWAASGPGGVDVRPVLMFVRRANYQPRISTARVLQQAGAEEYLARRMRFRIREAAGV